MRGIAAFQGDCSFALKTLRPVIWMRTFFQATQPLAESSTRSLDEIFSPPPFFETFRRVEIVSNLAPFLSEKVQRRRGDDGPALMDG
jgi:hypothetical protein